MKAVILFIATISLGVFSACRPAAKPVSISNTPVSINDVRQPGVPSKPIPQMSWTTADAVPQKLKDYEGKVVILDFWATYCEPCKREIPHLNELQAQYGTDKLQIVGLNVGGPEDKPKIPAFAEEMKFAYPIAFPEDALSSYVFGASDAIPQTAVFDKKGQLKIKIIGFDDRIRSQLDTAIADAMKE
jgi:thiol-disulfide isomerase/thioredoxin